MPDESPKTARKATSRSKTPGAALGAVMVLALLGGLGLVSSKPSKPKPVMVALPPSALLALTPPKIPNGDQPMSALHLVVSYDGTPMAARLKITRTKEEAKLRAEEAQARAQKGEDFMTLVAEYSDEVMNNMPKGVLASFRPSEALPAFGAAAAALRVGEISAVVETSLGFHVIKRTK